MVSGLSKSKTLKGADHLFHVCSFFFCVCVPNAHHSLRFFICFDSAGVWICVQIRGKWWKTKTEQKLKPYKKKKRTISTSSALLIAPTHRWKEWKIVLYIYRKHPGLAPSKAAHVFNKFLFKCKQMSACKHSGKPFSTEFMSIPFV